MSVGRKTMNLKKAFETLTASAGSPCVKMVCFFGKSIAFLPSPMVARNNWASNSRLFLEARRGIAEFRVLWDMRSRAVWRAILVEPWDSRGGDICTSPNPTSRHIVPPPGRAVNPRRPPQPQPLGGCFSLEKRSFRRKDAMGHELFCTVLLEQLSESRGGIRV
jgi:hypothetical protein